MELQFTRCRFLKNSSPDGAIWIDFGSIVVLSQNVFDSNINGVIFLANSPLIATITNNSFFNNSIRGASDIQTRSDWYSLWVFKLKMQHGWSQKVWLILASSHNQPLLLWSTMLHFQNWLTFMAITCPSGITMTAFGNVFCGGPLAAQRPFALQLM